MTAELALNMPGNEYRELPYCNSGAIRGCLENPAKWWAGRDKQEESPELLLGRACHRAILENRGDTVICGPALGRNDKIGKKQWAKVWTENRHCIVLKPDQFALYQAMIAAWRAQTWAHKFFQGYPEATFLWEMEDIPCKARLDCLCDGWIPDLKTSADASVSGFRREVSMRNLDVQLLFYGEAYRAHTGQWPRLLWVILEKVPPYLVAVREFVWERQDAAREKMLRGMEIFRQGTETGIWPGYPMEVVPL